MHRFALALAQESLAASAACPSDVGHAALDRWADAVNGAVSRRVVRLRHQARCDLKRLAQIRGACVVHPVTECDEGLFVGGHALAGRRVRASLGPCRFAVVFVVTLGEQVDKTLAAVSRNKRAYACVLDEGASRLAEAAIADWCERLSDELPDDLARTHRFSPGYCDWPLSEQQKVFDLLGDAHCGVRLDESLLMWPRKSVSGILGIGDTATVAAGANPCDSCGRFTCDHRRA